MSSLCALVLACRGCCHLLGEQGIQLLIHVLPHLAVLLDPRVSGHQRFHFQVAWPPLRMPPAQNQPGPLQNLEVP